MSKFLFLLFLLLSSLFGNNIELNEKEISYLKEKKIITMCVDPDWEPLEKINKNGINVSVIMMTAYGTIERAVEAMKLGAVDFINKPFKSVKDTAQFISYAVFFYTTF